MFQSGFSLAMSCASTVPISSLFIIGKTKKADMRRIVCDKCVKVAVCSLAVKVAIFRMNPALAYDLFFFQNCRCSFRCI